MIEKVELRLKSEFDGLELGVSLRVPERPWGILQLVHGMADRKSVV